MHPAPADTLEKIAYRSVENIPTVEPHDRDRLGYNVWRWLSQKVDSLEIVVKAAAPRLTINEKEALHKIREQLRSEGVES